MNYLISYNRYRQHNFLNLIPPTAELSQLQNFKKDCMKWYEIARRSILLHRTFHPIKLSFYLQKRRLNGETPQNKGKKRIKNKEFSLGHMFYAVTASKDYTIKH